MKAAVLEVIDAPLTVSEVGLGDVCAGQVLVKMKVSGICGAQLLEIGGHKGNAAFVPHLLGHEGCGIIEQVGEGVTTVSVGDKVVLHWRKGAGLESDFPAYEFKGKEIRSGKLTTFSEYTIVSENRVTAVPHDTPDDLCALLGCGLSTALGAVLAAAKVHAGESVLVSGLGGLGACAVKAARLVGSGVVICTDVADKTDMAATLKADRFINVTKEDARAIVTTLCPKGVDVIIETSGSSRASESLLPLLAGSGRFVMIGQPKPGESLTIENAKQLFDGEGKTIMATQGGGFQPHVDIPRYIEMYKEGRLSIDGLITHRVALQDINTAIDLMRTGKANRIMIDL